MKNIGNKKVKGLSYDYYLDKVILVSNPTKLLRDYLIADHRKEEKIVMKTQNKGKSVISKI